MIRGYYFITDSSLSRAGTLEDVRQAVGSRVSVVQYRNKEADSRTLFDEAVVLREICREVMFLVNDRVDIALAVDANGVHLGQRDLPYIAARKLLGKKKVIGLTVHSLDEALEAQDLGANYIGVSPIFCTSTKSDAGTPIGIDGLTAICKKVSIPVVAIGGVALENAQQVVHAGASALCAISAVLTKPDIQREIKKFGEFFRIN